MNSGAIRKKIKMMDLKKIDEWFDSEEFFKDEYEQISKSYFSVIEKLDEFYKTQNKV